MKDRIISMSQKKKIIFSIIAVLAVVIIAVMIWKICFASGYRTIKIYEVNGTANLERENETRMQAYENLVLKDQDLLDVAEESNVRLQMDDDKYALIEQNSVVSIKAQGDSENSKTDIILEKGTVVTEIRNKLGSSETYKVTTPNAVMAVRGTVFRVSQTTNEDGEEVAKLTVFDGVVSVQTRNEDGSLSEETLIESGQGADVIGQGADAQLICYETIDYEDLPAETLEFLRDMVDEQQEELSISRDDLSDLIENGQNTETQAAQNDTSADPAQESEDMQDTEAVKDTDTNEQSKEQESDDDDADDTAKSKQKTDSDKEDSSNKNKTKKNDKTSKSKSSTQDKADSKKNSASNTKSNNKKSASSQKDNDTKNKKNTAKTATTQSTAKATTQTLSNGAEQTTAGVQNTQQPVTTQKDPTLVATTESKNGQAAATTQQPKDSETTTEQVVAKVYTVTFTYNGKVFATQKVEEGSKAKKPVLKPSSAGEWKFDFDSVITEDTTVVFE